MDRITPPNRNEPTGTLNGDALPDSETLTRIRQFDTCTIANAIEACKVRLRNEGFTHPGLQCFNGLNQPRVLGFAATCRVRSADPPMSGGSYSDRTDWWDAIRALPRPRIAVIHDLDWERGSGSVMGEVHAAILKAFDCEGVITNGAVRDLPGLRRMGFGVLARSVAVSHAYTHIVDYGKPVEIFGLEVQAGDLLYADLHGVVSIPLQVAHMIPGVASRIRDREKRIIDACESRDFSPERLLRMIQSAQEPDA
jgi:regulator of RNase E activity RraA